MEEKEAVAEYSFERMGARLAGGLREAGISQEKAAEITLGDGGEPVG